MNFSDEIAQRFQIEAEMRVLYEDLVREVSGKVNSRDLDALELYLRVELGLGAKGMKSWRAVAHLFFGGFPEDAETVLRTLVDVVVDMRFISLVPEERAQRFDDYRVAHGLRWVREARESELVSPEEIARLEADFRRKTAKVMERRPEWEKSLPLSWFNVSTKAKAEAIDEPRFYQTFMIGSSYTHPNVVSLASYFRRTKSAVQVLTEPRVPEEPRSFIDSCLYLQVLLEHMNGVMHLEMNERCEQSRGTLEKVILERYPDVEEEYEEIRRRRAEQVETEPDRVKRSGE